MAYRMLINGKLVDGARTLDVFNPATGGVWRPARAPTRRNSMRRWRRPRRRFRHGRR